MARRTLKSTRTASSTWRCHSSASQSPSHRPRYVDRIDRLTIETLINLVCAVWTSREELDIVGPLRYARGDFAGVYRPLQGPGFERINGIQRSQQYVGSGLCASYVRLPLTSAFASCSALVILYRSPKGELDEYAQTYDALINVLRSS
jgi:hypothetical protein